MTESNLVEPALYLRKIFVMKDFAVEKKLDINVD